jgi:DNA polymerase
MDSRAVIVLPSTFLQSPGRSQHLGKQNVAALPSPVRYESMQGLTSGRGAARVNPVPPATQTLSAEAAALAWLVEAGCDALVGDAPRNWLAAPPPPPPAPVAVTRPRPAPVAARPQASAAAAEAAAGAGDLAALEAAVAAFAHPLRIPDVAPRLITGAAASGLLVLADMPDPPGSAAALLLARMLAAIGLDESSLAQGHLLPWTTPGGRPVKDEDVAAFAPFAARARALMAPRLVLALGDRAAALAGEARGVAALRGRWHALDGVPTMITFHPRRLLTQPELKRLAWADLQAFAARRESLT